MTPYDDFLKKLAALEQSGAVLTLEHATMQAEG